MAYETGTATDYLDLLDKLVTFMVANGWVSNRYETTGDYEFLAKGTGLAGTDNIYVGITTYSDEDLDYYNWRLQGALGYDASKTFDLQPGAIPAPTIGRTPVIHLWNSNIPYWFIVNSRRAIVVAKVSTVYQIMYIGYILPYLPPSMMPYPLAIVGTSVGACAGMTTYTGERWSQATPSHSLGVLDPVCDLLGATSDIVAQPNGNFRFWFQEWGAIANKYIYTYDGGGTARTVDSRQLWPLSLNNVDLINRLRPRPNDSSYSLLPIIVTHRLNSPNVFGELEGIYQCSGFNNASENVIQIPDGVSGYNDYLVIQNVFRTGQGNYCAVRLT